ncbi:hypothetical protein Baya_13279 [Bagarius yarrelli]|uniref:Uncharacterized protein n=1 Tax=Bagarius yarrelli TaxID=175774 RepID=A0A556V5M9_BAGYA|nr:hypothetical protein Baya_13279 [Bagarius yarrelli]
MSLRALEGVGLRPQAFSDSSGRFTIGSIKECGEATCLPEPPVSQKTQTTGASIRPFSENAFSQRVMLTRTSLYRWRCSYWKQRSNLIDDNQKQRFSTITQPGSSTQEHPDMVTSSTTTSRLSFPTILQMHIKFCNLPQGDKAYEMLELQHPTARARQCREVLIAISISFRYPRSQRSSCCPLSVRIRVTTEASWGRSSNRHQVLSIVLYILPPPTTGCGPVWPGFTLSGYLPVKANGVRMGRTCPDFGSPEPALVLALAPFCSINGKLDECKCLCTDSRDEFVCLREEQEGLNTLPPGRVT